MRRQLILFALTSLFHLSTSASLLCGITNETPFHNNIQSMTTTSPYSILTSVSTAYQSETVTLRIKSVLSELKFEGFIVHAFSTDRPGEVLGRFISPAEGLTLNNCNGEDNVATYRTYPGESEVELQWEAPSDYAGKILFNATVAHDYDTFWAGITSSPLQVVRSEAAALKSYFISPSVPSNQIANQEIEQRNSDLIYEGCGTTKTCFGLPNNCVEQQSCQVVATAFRINNRFEFELKSNVDGVAYVALGLSSDNFMGEDAVMECINQNGIVQLFSSYNHRRSNTREAVPQNILSLEESSLLNGTIYCKFQREAVTTVLGIDFNLLSQRFYFLLAIGTSFSNAMIDRHDLARTASLQPLHIIERRDVNAIYEGCGSTKTCVGLPVFPVNCLTDRSCTAIATAANIDNRFVFEQQSSAAGVGYVSFGLSRSPTMGDTAVMECVQEGGIIREYNSWNFPRSNTRVGVPQNITSMIDSSFVDGTIYCKVERDAFTTILEHEFDLHSEQFYFQVAIGTAFSSTSILMHNLGRMASTEPLQIIRPGTDPIYEGCETENKACFGMPDGCVEEFSCEAIVTVSEEDEEYEFELQSHAGNVNYVSFALSEDDIMGDDSSVECIRQGDNTVRAFTSWNIARPTLGNTRENVPQTIINLRNSTFTDGRINCKVRRNKSTVVRDRTFHLAQEDFYFLLAIGSRSSASAIYMHDLGHAVSAEALKLPGRQSAAFAVRLSAISIVAWLLVTSCAHLYRGS